MSVPDWMALFHVLSQVVKLWWTSCTRSSWPFSLGTLHVSDVLPDAVSLHGGPQRAMPLVLPGMVHGVITGVSTLSRPSLDSGLLGPHSIGQCARPSGPSGRTGKTASPGSPARTLVLPLAPFDALFAALLLPEVILLRKSGFLQTQAVLFRNMRSWTVGGHTSPASVHVVPRLMMRSSRFDAVVSSPTSPGLFDASFSSSESRHALTQCVDSAVGLDGLTYSLFKANFPWWQEAILSFLNLTLAWGVVPSLWKHSIVVPVFKRGDPSDPHNYRPISLASCFFKLLEHLVHSRISPHISPQLDESQGGFRWGADLLVGSLVSVLSSRSNAHTFVAFIDISEGF